MAPSIDAEVQMVNGDTKKPAAETAEDPYSKVVLRYDEYWDYRTYSYKLRKSAKPERKLKHKSPLLVIRRHIDEKGRHVDTDIDIKSPILCAALTEINDGVEGLKLRRTPPVCHPNLFYHSLSKLEERLVAEQSRENPDEDNLTHLRLGIRFAKEEHVDTIQSLETLFAANEIVWDLLWALFTPNTLAYHYHSLTEQSQILIIRSTKIARRMSGVYYYNIICDVITNDGDAFGYAKVNEHEIDHYEGAHLIQDLSIFPLKFHPEKDRIVASAITRAKKYVGLTGHTYQEIIGAGMREIRTSDYKPKLVKFNTFGRLMVDPKSFRAFAPEATYNLPVYRKVDRRKLSDDELAICSPIVLGFCFGVKMWGGFAIDRCVDVAWGDEAFPSLVLDKAKKSLIRALVRQHNVKNETFDDVIKGKGKGLVGLLSGKPGCGKTMTAEAISEVTRQPLYTVSAGELGTAPKDLDERLTLILELSQKWNAILLLDEADVFLQARDNLDIARNALVSIFLRQLEYYQGIMILTTNRIGNCDPAFESRIQFSFHYPELDFESRKFVWKTFWKKALGQKSLDGHISDEDIDSLAKHVLNGRQIKNTVSSAHSLALEEGVPLAKYHADTVLEVVQAWDNAPAD